MKREVGPTWSLQDREAGQRFANAWEEHFRAAGEQYPLEPAPAFDEDTRVTQVLNQQVPALMRYPNVVGVSEGIRTRGGVPTGERCLVVYVQRKVPRDQLSPDDVLPRGVDGVGVDVVEVGAIEPLPASPNTGR